MKTMAVVAIVMVCQLPSEATAPPQRTGPPQATAAQRSAPTGDARAGKAFWEQPTTFCPVCHGERGQGAYGPDLAGRRLSVTQFRRQVRQSWGVMPRWTPQQISDRTLADVHAYLTSLRPVEKPGPWTTPVPRNAPQHLRYFVETYGCGQCHGTDMEAVFFGAAYAKMDFAWFAQTVYNHTTDFPSGRMGSFSRDRLPEAMLRIMWNATLAEVRGREKAKGTQQAKPQAGPVIKPPTAVRPTNSTK
jgi:mono/diheme cytochrome c family protein